MDAANVFHKKLKDVLYIAKEYYDKIIHIYLLTESEMKTKKNCHICEKSFYELSRKFADHDHLTGQFRGSAHDDCNLNYKIPQFIPTFFTISQNTILIYLLNSLVKIMI
jgi:hypothetical protein